MSQVIEYDSVGEFLREMEQPQYATTASAIRPSGDWNGYSRSLAHAVQIVRDGVRSALDDCAKLVDRVNVDLPTFERRWEATVAGPVPIVPAAIAGLPDNMMAPLEEETSGVPLRIFVSICTSGGCDERVIHKRGVALLALLQTVSARRPVELCLFGDMGSDKLGLVTPVVRVAAMPLDLSTLTAALTHASVQRRLFFCWGEKRGWTSQWAWGTYPTHASAQQKTRAALGARPDDLVIFGAFLSESDLILKDPCKWVQHQVALTEQQYRDGERLAA